MFSGGGRPYILVPRIPRKWATGEADFRESWVMGVHIGQAASLTITRKKKKRHHGSETATVIFFFSLRAQTSLQPSVHFPWPGPFPHSETPTAKPPEQITTIDKWNWIAKNQNRKYPFFLSAGPTWTSGSGLFLLNFFFFFNWPYGLITQKEARPWAGSKCQERPRIQDGTGTIRPRSRSGATFFFLIAPTVVALFFFFFFFVFQPQSGCENVFPQSIFVFCESHTHWAWRQVGEWSPNAE